MSGRTLEPGQARGHAGFTWADHVDWMVATAGSLAAVAERLCARRGHEESVASAERALRRLRERGQEDGGKWGVRALAVFGVPDAADARARWMGAYHSRFTDLPVSVCEDLVRFWDRPPLSQSRGSRIWLSLAHATCALRRGDEESARASLEQARRALPGAPASAQVELLLTDAFLASRHAVDEVPSRLSAIEPLLGALPDTDFPYLHVRWIDQRAYHINKKKDFAGAEALYRALPERGSPAFVLCRRANGLAYARWKQGHLDEARALAREAARQAGDGGHVRMRAMALAMLGRILRGPEGEDAKARAIAIARQLDDENLRLRFER